MRVLDDSQENIVDVDKEGCIVSLFDIPLVRLCVVFSFADLA